MLSHRRVFLPLLLLLLGLQLHGQTPVERPPAAGADSSVRLVPLESAEGERRLAGALTAGQASLSLFVHFENQRDGTSCGPCSATVALNALKAPRPAMSTDPRFNYFDQANFFTDETAAAVLRNPRATTDDLRSLIKQAGLTLDQLAAAVESKQVARVTVRHVAPERLEQECADFRAALKAALESKDQVVIVNFARQSLSQPGTGHFSVVAACDEDQALILDVARARLAPVFVPIPALVRSMATLDRDAGQMRGYLIVAKRAEP